MSGAQPRRPIEVACALVEREGRLLVAQRPPGKSLALKWEFPGGKIEKGETASAALVRELREELGLEVEVGRELACVTHDYGEVFIALIPFRCTPRGAEPRPREHVDIRWCTPEEIDALDLAEADKPVLAAWRDDLTMHDMLGSLVGRAPARGAGGANATRRDEGALGSPIFDLVAFLAGLAMAWHFSWKTRDLVWSLWLSSLLVGYATIVVGCIGSMRRGATAVGGQKIAGVGGALFVLAFFTVHYGGFHLGHSVFLNLFFPLRGEGLSAHGFFGLDFDAYFSVFRSYWPFILVAALAERAAFVQALREFKPMQSYANVVRMHLLIFFFAGVSIIGVESFPVYAVVYAVYFFPWRFVREQRAARKT